MDDVALCLDIRSTCLQLNLQFKLLSLPISLPSNRWDEAGALTYFVLDTIALFAFINLLLCPESDYHLCHEFLPQLKKNTPIKIHLLSVAKIERIRTHVLHSGYSSE